MIEAQSRYINGLIQPVLGARTQGKALSLTPKADKIKSYDAEIQDELMRSSFNDENCNSWYKDETGRITNNWSRTVLAYQHMVKEVDLEDYNVEGSGVTVVKDRLKIHVGRAKEETILSDRMLVALGLMSAAIMAGGWLIRNPHIYRMTR